MSETSEPDQLKELHKALAEPTKGPKVPHRACLCGKLLQESEFTVNCHSGIVNFAECLCAECRKETAGFVRIVCLGCRGLMCMVAPQKVSTGFEFKTGTCVHVEKCQSCSPGLTAVPVLEHLRFCRDRGIPTNVDKDIVQEAEQKALQGERAADKLREELKDKFDSP